MQPNIRYDALSAYGRSARIPAMPKKRGPHQHKSKKKSKDEWKTFVKQWRIRRDLTVAELAEEAGLSTGNVSGIENATQGYSADSLRALAKALDVTTGMLLDVNPEDGPGIWDLWSGADATQRSQITEIVTTIVKPKR